MSRQQSIPNGHPGRRRRRTRHQALALEQQLHIDDIPTYERDAASFDDTR
jgi:hypothetical protein